MHRDLRRLLALLTLLVLTAPFAGATAIPPREVAPNDQAVWHRFVLDNGLRVLLLSDPKLNKSSAALAVEAGSNDNPPERPGLAHFLEHMLFLGTGKYPGVSDYSGYITANGGYNNAYTASDHTNYMFEVRHEAFEGALDRFARFFIDPLFTPEFTEREITAINNEAARYRENDGRRTWEVRRHLYAEGSPERKFGTGNRETLAGVTREELLRFYETHYSADRMALVLTGRASIAEMEGWVRRFFAEIPRRELPPLARQPGFLPRAEALRVATIEPIKDVRQLGLEFELPATRPDALAKPAELIGALVGYEGRGGLLDHLKQAGLASALAAGTYERTAAYGSFLVTIDLTPQGLAEQRRVLETVFAYLDLLRASPYPADFFAERAAMARIEETYRDRGEGADLATGLAVLALFHPLEYAEREPYLWVQPDEAAYRRVLAALTPDNLLVTVTAKGLPAARTTEFYDIRYDVSEDAAAYAGLRQPPAIAGLRLPAPNPYIPRSTALLAEQPVRVIDEPALSLFYSQDREFARPMSALVFRVRPDREQVDARAAVLARFLQDCVREAVAEVADDARLAGISFNVAAGAEGLQVAVDGYSGSAEKFLEHLTGQLVGFALPAERFAAVKDRILRELASWPRSETYQIAQAHRAVLGREFAWLPSELLPLAGGVTQEEVQAFARRFLGAGRVEGLAHGNLDAATAIAAARRLQTALGTQAVPAERLVERRFTVLEAGEAVREAGRVAGNNSCFWRDYLFAADTPETRAAAQVLSNFLQEPFYTEMRTKQQLGYLVWGGASAADRQAFAYFVIQSGEYAPDELQRRAEAFLATVPDLFAALPAEQFATLVAGARTALTEKEKTIAEKAGVLFSRAYTFRGDWSRQADTVAALDVLTQERTAAILRELLDPAKTRSRTFLLVGRDHQTATPLESTFADREAWKKSRRFE